MEEAGNIYILVLYGYSEKSLDSYSFPSTLNFKYQSVNV